MKVGVRRQNNCIELIRKSFEVIFGTDELTFGKCDYFEKYKKRDNYDKKD